MQFVQPYAVGKVGIKILLSGLLLVLLVQQFSQQALAQNQHKIDSLNQLLKTAPKDSTQIDILVNLWRATAYNDVSQAINYGRQIIVKSKELNYLTGEATGYQRLGIAYSFTGQNDSSFYFYHKALSIYRKTRSQGLEGVMLYNLGLLFQSESQYDSAIHYINLAGSLFQSLEDKKKLGAVYDALSSINQEKGNYRIALAYVLQAAALFAEVNDVLRLADAKLKIGDAYSLMGNQAAAFPYYKECLATYKRNNDQQYVVETSIKIGTIVLGTGKIDSAILIFSESLLLAEDLASPRLVAVTKSSLGSCYLAAGKPSTALKYFNKSYQLAREINEVRLFTPDLINIAKAKVLQGRLNEAEMAAKEALGQSIESSINESIKDATEVLADIYKRQGNFKESLKYYTQFKAINDSLYNANKSAQITELQTLYETEKRENKIADQAEEIKFLNQQAQIDELRKKLLTYVIISLLMISGLVYYGLRQKVKRTKLQQERDKANYEKELTFRKKELTTHTLHMVQKNELLEEIKEKIDAIRRNSTENKGELNRLLQRIKNDNVAERDWQNFKMYFEQVHEDFDKKLREQFNDLTNNEMRLAALMKMNLTTKEMANILNISPDSVNKARYRLRKKLNLATEENLADYILAL